MFIKSLVKGLAIGIGATVVAADKIDGITQKIDDVADKVIKKATSPEVKAYINKLEERGQEIIEEGKRTYYEYMSSKKDRG